MSIKELTAYRNATVNTFLEAAAEDGWHMRPDEATSDMLDAGLAVMPSSESDWNTYADIYRAMLADPTAQFEWDK